MKLSGLRDKPDQVCQRMPKKGYGYSANSTKASSLPNPTTPQVLIRTSFFRILALALPSQKPNGSCLPRVESRDGREPLMSSEYQRKQEEYSKNDDMILQ